jgi:hypothetical protein
MGSNHMRLVLENFNDDGQVSRDAFLPYEDATV